MSEHTDNGVAYEMYEGAECAVGLCANGEAQELAIIAKTGRGIAQSSSRTAHARAAWRNWARLTRDERLGFIAEAYKTYPQGT